MTHPLPRDGTDCVLLELGDYVRTHPLPRDGTDCVLLKLGDCVRTHPLPRDGTDCVLLELSDCVTPIRYREMVLTVADQVECRRKAPLRLKIPEPTIGPRS